MTKVSQPTIQEDLARVYKAISKQASKDSKLELQRVYEDLLKVVESSKEIETEQLTKDILQAATVPTTPTEEVDDPCTPSSDDEIASLPDKTSIIQPVSVYYSISNYSIFAHSEKTKDGWEYNKKLSSLLGWIGIGSH